jgi:sugar O-acyltransferase (sialic acid O-acetyltransferase NeuD family)
MLVLGAKGFAKEVLEILFQIGDTKDLKFYDDLSTNLGKTLFSQFEILKSIDEAKAYFHHIDNRFTIGLGNPSIRKQLHDRLTNIGGVLTSTISNKSTIGRFDVEIGHGANIMTGVIITNSIKIGMASLINLNTTIGHDSVIGDFVEMSPGSHVSGNCKIGDYSVLGTNSVLLPKVKIGNNVIVGAGAVVNKDVPDNVVVAGIPAKIIKELSPLFS